MKRQIVIYAILCVVCFSGHIATAGEIRAWGSDNDGLKTGIPTDTDFIAVTAGDRHAFALKSDGTVVGWGDDSGNLLNIPAEDNNNIVAIAAGLEFTLALKEDGSIIGWGDDDNGLETGRPTDLNFVTIAAGRWHGLAIREDGTAEGWGGNATGQADVPSGNDFIAIGGGAYHSVAVRGDGETGSIDTWGTTAWGLSNKPLGSDFVAVDAGYFHGLALREDGTLAAWGIPNVNEGQVSDTPTDDGYVEIAAGYDFNIARKDDGTLKVWGNDGDNQITDMPSDNSFIAIAAGTATGFAIYETGTLTLTSPNGAEVLKTGTLHTITWDTDPIDAFTNVWIEYSTDNGDNWILVGPPNEGNTGSYEWLVPVATSQECLVRVRHSPTSITEGGTDQSDAPLTIYYCPLTGDVTGDCVVNEDDIALIESQWLYSYDPFAEPVDRVDFNGDGSIDIGDLRIIGIYWLRSDCGEFGCEGTNVDGIGEVDLHDLAEVGKYWGSN